MEVKATTGNAKSLKTVMGQPDIYGPCQACKLSEYNIGEVDGILTMPYYLSFMLR